MLEFISFTSSGGVEPKKKTQEGGAEDIDSCVAVK